MSSLHNFCNINLNGGPVRAVLGLRTPPASGMKVQAPRAPGGHSEDTGGPPSNTPKSSLLERLLPWPTVSK